MRTRVVERADLDQATFSALPTETSRVLVWIVGGGERK